MFTHIENFIILFLGLVQGLLLYIVTRSHVNVSKLALLIICLIAGLLISAIELTFIIKKLRKKEKQEDDLK